MKKDAAVSTKKFELQVTGSTTAYLKLPTHPGVLRHAKNVTLVDLLGAYRGPYVVFDFDSNDVLVGIEIIGEDEDDSGEEDDGQSQGGEEAPSEDDGP